LPDPHAVDLAFELIGKIVAAVGPRRRERECGKKSVARWRAKPIGEIVVVMSCANCPLRCIEACENG